MPKVNINHVALAKNWEGENEIVKNPKTVIVGSFNPYNPEWGDDLPADFYYGRIPLRGPGNYLWPRIAALTGKNIHFFRGNKNRKVQAMKELGFVFFDFVDSIHLQGASNAELNEAKEKKYFNSFNDGDVWANNLNHDNQQIDVSRIYNLRLINYLSNTNSIENVMITLGTVRGQLLFNAGEEWNNYRQGFKETAGNRLVPESWSPAPQGVRGDIEGFDRWLKTYLLK